MDPFIGQIQAFPYNFAPRGWAFCDGQLLAISSNTALFSLLGTTYGGDGRSTFGLPDLRGRVPIHSGKGPGLTSRQLGQRAGAETTTLTTNQSFSCD
jgi:microcystin-dependent protein